MEAAVAETGVAVMEDKVAIVLRGRTTPRNDVGLTAIQRGVCQEDFVYVRIRLQRQRATALPRRKSHRHRGVTAMCANVNDEIAGGYKLPNGVDGRLRNRLWLIVRMLPLGILDQTVTRQIKFAYVVTVVGENNA